MKNIFCIISIGICLSVGSINAQDKSLSDSEVKFFETKIRPALVKYCYQCHSLEHGDSRAGLLVDTRDGLHQGGDSGPAIVPGKLDESLFWEAINWDGYEMPPSQQMPNEVIADFKKWIEMGAPDPRVRKLLNHNSKISDKDIQQAKSHWAFQKPTSNANVTIDGLITEKMEKAGLKPSPAADALTLLRRLNYDLIGLPPTMEEITSFEKAWKKDSDSAIEAKTDELLKRPQYGERWGRHWLDVARYAESAGVINSTFPHAWRYRDYVIDSFNTDTPYDQFLTEQIAGDLIPAKSDAQWQKNLIATGFLAIGLKRLNEKNPRIFTADMIDEQIDAVTQATLGMTVACARCHDHKFDPIPTKDYYAMAGIFASTKTYYGTVGGQQNHRPSDLLLLPIIDKTQEGGQSIAQLEAQLKKLQEEKLALRKGIQSGKEKVRIDFLKIKNKTQRIQGEIATLNADGTKKTFGMAVQEADEIVNRHILIGGEVDLQAQEVPRGFLQILSDVNFEVSNENSSGRLELAKALTSTDNPLTARVMVNRVWMHLLGKPLVGTPNNFGLSGLKPENQELLDYLALRFIDKGWSVKSLVREIVLTDAYKRSSQFKEANYEIDPDNNLFWRVAPKQLDAEAIRDTMLMVSGQLELERPNGSAISKVGDTRFDRSGSKEALDADARYRSVYLSVVRSTLNESMSLFDFPDPTASNSARAESIVPTQALYMMNSEFAADQARSMATSLAKRFRTTNEQVRNAFLQTYGRPATDVEIKASVQFFREFNPPKQTQEKAAANTTSRRKGRGGAQSGSNDATRNRQRNRQNAAATPDTTAIDASTAKLAVFCQTLMASAEFRILN